MLVFLERCRCADWTWFTKVMLDRGKDALMGVRLAQVAVDVAVQHHAKPSDAMNQGGRPARIRIRNQRMLGVLKSPAEHRKE